MNNYISTVLDNSSIKIFGPAQATSLIKEIWDDRRYTKNYVIEADNIIVDIGANIGIFSLFAASQGAKVYAIEPNPETFEILKKNIAENYLTDKIIALNYAISDGSGYVDLQIPDSDKIYALGSATIMEKIKNDLCAHQDFTFKTIRVGTISIKAIIEKYIGVEQAIDFIKVDCEGAEFSIFKGLDSGTAEKILNIAMETHEGYSEKELVSFLNHNGFIIEDYIKRAGHYKTGYCYAKIGKSKNSKQERNVKPVALLTVPDSGIISEPIAISAEESFNLNAPQLPLRFSWNIDDTMTQELNSRFEYSFSTPGAHRIACTISNGHEADRVEKKIVVFQKDYGQKAIEWYLGKESEKVIVTVKDGATFCVKKNNFPKTWNFDSIIISLMAGNKDLSSLGAELSSNGLVHEMKSYYNEVEIDSVCADIDLIFELKLNREVDIEFKWWAKKIVKEGDACVGADGKGRSILGEISSEKCYTVDGQTEFTVLKENFPKDWTPRCFKFGIAAISINGLNTPLNGYFKYNTTQKLLTDWYTEISLSECCLNSDILFSIFFNEKRNIKIAWWAE